MRISYDKTLFRSPNPADRAPCNLGWRHDLTKKGGKVNWTAIKKMVQESIDACESQPGRVERIEIQIQAGS